MLPLSRITATHALARWLDAKVGDKESEREISVVATVLPVALTRVLGRQGLPQPVPQNGPFGAIEIELSILRRFRNH